ncbi:hypothetical protein BR93DRAFT_632665 [Coniochaeta sp. PMI_546]|nr:hypothetical protein BR93DRAFT_632665 [Coniochaeta sp. PMI_546]
MLRCSARIEAICFCCQWLPHTTSSHMPSKLVTEHNILADWLMAIPRLAQKCRRVANGLGNGLGGVVISAGHGLESLVFLITFHLRNSNRTQESRHYARGNSIRLSCGPLDESTNHSKMFNWPRIPLALD